MSIEQARKNRQETSNLWDLLDRPTNIVWRKVNGNTLRSFNYAYDMAGCITNVLMEGEALPSRATVYGYDMLDRLTAETTPGRTNTWSYDLADNRTNATHNGTATAYTLGIGDRLSSTSAGATYLYNAAGCVTNISSELPVSSVVSLSWNGQYQLTSVVTNGVLAESYTYDACSRRVSTTTYPLPLGEGQGEGETTFHVYDDNWQVLADLDANGNPLRSYTWAPGIDHLLAMTVYTETATNTYYALTDHLGTVHAMAGTNGVIVESYGFDAWGNVLAVYDASGSPISNRQSAIGNRYLFQGREYSYATGLYHFRHRWYDPATGRWMSNDPIGISGGLNQYAFCIDNPVNILDPRGLATYLVNREIGGSEVRSKYNPLTHTFVAVLHSDGSVSTYGWGTTYNDKKQGLWGTEVQNEWDRLAAEKAIRQGKARRVGGSDLDPYVPGAYEAISKDPTSFHRWWLWNNCKHEARDLIRRAKRLEKSDTTRDGEYAK